MKKSIFLVLILLTGPFVSFGQKSNNLTFYDLREVKCESVDERSREKRQLECMLVDVVLDSLNYFPSKTRKTFTPITSPKTAWVALRKLYPQYKDEEFRCWTEYFGYYIFSLDCGMTKNKNECSFLCMLYIPIGGNEFWYFVPRT